jgi:acyl carrier protein
MRKALHLTEAEASALDRDATPLTVRGWTSLAHVQLMVEVERAFDIVFEADEIVDLASVGAIADALARRNVPPNA